MATQLTDRQKEIKALIEQEGLTAVQIGERLQISTNAVYQQLRRMRSGKPAAKAKAKAAAKTGSKSAGKPQPPAAAPKPGPAQKVVEVEKLVTHTPLQAVRARRDAIKSALAETGDALAAAERAVKVAKEGHEKATRKHAEELKVLDGAESALTGKKIVDGKPAAPKPAAAPKASGGGNGRGKAPAAPSAPASAPSGASGSASPSSNGTSADDDAAKAEAAAAQAAAEAPQP